MENRLVQDLDEILKSVHKLNEKYLHILNANKELTVKIEILKVESEQLKQQNNNNKEAVEVSEEGRNNSLLKSEEPSKNIDLALKETEKNAQIKMQLDGFIEDIDQCIQIIQAKE
jgi:hypothetical protein